jgi:hypothetical protein
MLCRYTFRLDPNAAQDTALRGQLLMLGELWNALLQRREDVYRRERRRLSKHEQYKEITDLRAECPEWAVLSVAAARGVAYRLDNLFRRAKAGASGQWDYPRYKSADRWTSISFTECSGLKLARLAGEARQGWLARLRQGRFRRDQSLRSAAAAADVVAHWHDHPARRRMAALGSS